MPAIRLCAPTIIERDAIGNFCIGLAGLLNRSGYEASIYAQHFHPDSRALIRPIESLFREIGTSDVLLVNYSIFDPFLRDYLALRNPKICIFQNVTPPEFFEGWSNELHALCTQSYEQIPLLANFDRLAAHSKFTADTLRAHLARQPSITVFPPFFKSQYEGLTADGSTSWRLPNSALFVGRVVPNKRLENIIKVVHKLRQRNPAWKLAIVGSEMVPSYRSHLATLANSLKLDASQVNFAGSVPNEELYRHYRTASCFICLSEHEGFCVPVLEAMLFGQPVFALSAGAVPEVLEGSGVLLDSPDETKVAEIIHTTMQNPSRVSDIVGKQRERALAILRQGDGRAIIQLVNELSTPRPMRAK